MGVSYSPAESAAKMFAAASALERVPHSTITRCVIVTKKTISSFAPSSLRNVGRNGRKLTVRDNTGTYPDGAKSTIYAVGRWPLIERDIKPHAIPKLKGSRSRGAKALYGPAFGGVSEKRLVTPYGVRAQVWHPGTKGKHPFERGAEAAIPLFGEIQHAETITALGRIF